MNDEFYYPCDFPWALLTDSEMDKKLINKCCKIHQFVNKETWKYKMNWTDQERKIDLN